MRQKRRVFREASVTRTRRRFLGDAATLGASAAVGPWVVGSTVLAVSRKASAAAHVSDDWMLTLNPVAAGTVIVESVSNVATAVDVYFGRPYDPTGVTHYAIFANGAFVQYVQSGYVRVKDLPPASAVEIAVRAVSLEQQLRASDEIGRGYTLGGDTGTFTLELGDVIFDSSDPDRILARIPFSLLNDEGDAVASMATTRWGIEGESRPYDHTSAAPYVAHSQRIPAKAESTSQPDVTEGTYLAAGETYEYQVEASDDRGNSATSPVLRFTVPLAGSWSPTEWVDLPAGAWDELNRDDTGHVRPNSDFDNNSAERIFFTSPPGDSKPAYEHRTRTGDSVQPMGVDSPVFPEDFSAVRRVLLRYHHWIDDFSGRPGKVIFLGVGQGWIGDDYGEEGDEYGIDAGGGVNVMHPKVGTHPDGEPENGFRMLGSFQDQKKKFGENIDPPTSQPDKGRWLTIDLIITKDEGYVLQVDNQPVVKNETKRDPVVGNWNDCKGIWYRHRNMHGGKPENEELFALRNSTEWFGGFFLFVER